MDELIYRDYFRQQQYREQQANKRHTDKDIELLLDDAFKPEPESDEPFFDKYERHECNPVTMAEFIHLEKYGYFLRLK